MTKIWRKVLKEDEPDVAEPYIPDWYVEGKHRELDILNEQIEAMTFNPSYRPPWGAWFTAQELISIARHEGVNPYRMAWWDGLDSVVIKEAKRGHFKRPGPGITELKYQQARLRKEIAYLAACPEGRRGEDD